MSDVERLKKIIIESNNIVFFGGAGVSTESGIKDFRGKDGLYKENNYKYPPEYMLSHSCLINHPDLFFDYYRNKMNCLDYEPNITHKYLTELERKRKLKAIITQNIDGLHQKAGSQNILELHGTVYKAYCMDCYKKYDGQIIFKSKSIPKCECGGIIRPEVVLYEEALPDTYMIACDYISKADVLIVAGTSLTVEPASSMIRLFKGNHLIIINNEPTPYDYRANFVINDNMGKVFKMIGDKK